MSELAGVASSDQSLLTSGYWADVSDSVKSSVLSKPNEIDGFWDSTSSAYMKNVDSYCFGETSVKSGVTSQNEDQLDEFESMKSWFLESVNDFAEKQGENVNLSAQPILSPPTAHEAPCQPPEHRIGSSDVSMMSVENVEPVKPTTMETCAEFCEPTTPTTSVEFLNSTTPKKPTEPIVAPVTPAGIPNLWDHML